MRSLAVLVFSYLINVELSRSRLCSNEPELNGRLFTDWTMSGVSAVASDPSSTWWKRSSCCSKSTYAAETSRRPRGASSNWKCHTSITSSSTRSVSTRQCLFIFIRTNYLTQHQFSKGWIVRMSKSCSSSGRANQVLRTSYTFTPLCCS